MTDLDKAVERLTAVLKMLELFGDRKIDSRPINAADLRTLLTALSAKDAELAKAREALNYVKYHSGRAVQQLRTQPDLTTRDAAYLFEDFAERIQALGETK